MNKRANKYMYRLHEQKVDYRLTVSHLNRRQTMQHAAKPPKRDRSSVSKLERRASLFSPSRSKQDSKHAAQIQINK